MTHSRTFRVLLIGLGVLVVSIPIIQYIRSQPRQGPMSIMGIDEGLTANDARINSLVAKLDEVDEWGETHEALIECGVDAVPALTEMLLDQSKPLESRRAAAIILGFIGPPAKDAIPALVEVLTDPSAGFPRRASQALTSIDTTGEAVIPALIGRMNHPDGELRACMYETLLELRRPDSRLIQAIPILIDGMNDEHDKVRLYSAGTLGRLGPEGKPAVPCLLNGLQDKHTTVRLWAARSLWYIDPQTSSLAVLVLLELTKEENSYIRESAGYFLEKIDPDAALQVGVK